MMQENEGTSSPRMEESLCTDLGLESESANSYQDNWLNPSCYPEPIFDRFTNWWTSIHFCPVACLQFRGNTLVSGSIEKVIKIWDINLITCPNTLFGHEGPIRCLKFEGTHDKPSKLNNGIISDSDSNDNHSKQNRSQQNPSTEEQIQQHKNIENSKEYNSNIKTQSQNASSGANAGFLQLTESNPTVSNDLIVSGADDFRIKFWQLSTGYPLLTIKAHNDRVCCIALLQNIILSGSGDQTLRVWNRSIATNNNKSNSAGNNNNNNNNTSSVQNVAPLSTLTGHEGSIWCISVSEEEPYSNGVGRKVVTGSADETVKIWDIEKGTAICTMRGHKSSVASVGVHGNMIVSGSLDRSVMVWDMRLNGSGGPTRKLVEHSGAVGCVQMDDVKVVSGSADECVKIWDLRNVSQGEFGGASRSVNTIRQDTAVACLQFDKARLAVGTRKKLKMFDYSI